MQFPRESGILLHPTSLPGPHGVGDMGPAAFRFVDWLANAGQRLWQIMPLGPTGFGDSPYSSTSAFAGNPILISLTWLQGDGLLEQRELDDSPAFPEGHVDFEAVTAFKDRLLRVAFARFVGPAGDSTREDYTTFEREHGWWLDDFARFVATKRSNDLDGWHDWPTEARLRTQDFMGSVDRLQADEIAFQKFVQYQFERQWQVLRRYANERSIRIVGDIPIFVAADSADAWSNREQFRTNAEGQPEAVAGVPPDPFAEFGQVWGNPLYDWDQMSQDDFVWWKQRIRRTLDLVDIIRIDHFRGFAATWSVPADADNASHGHWERVPGGSLFASIRREFGELPIVIEDLGVITPDVVTLRQIFGFPGMKVLHFAFENEPANVYFPHNYEPHSVVYTATHDNQTTVGWFASRSEQERADVQTYLGRDGTDIAWDLIRLALASVSNTCIVPMQDVLRLGDEARMNVPGVPYGNWSWRFREHDLDHGLALGLNAITTAFGRNGYRVRLEQNPWDYTNPHGEHRATPWPREH